MAAAFVLSSCYYVDAVFDVNQEEELDVRIDSAIHEDFANADTARSTLQDQFAGEGMSRSNYSEGPWNGYRWSENNADPYNWEIERDNGDFIKFEREGDNVKYTAKFTIGGEVGDREDEAKDVLDVKFSLDHAGTVISTNGNQSSATRITWTGQWDSTLNMEAVIDLTPEPAPAEPAEEPAEEPEPVAEPEEAEVVEEEAETTVRETEEEPVLTLAADAVGATAVATSEITTESGEIALDGMVYPARTVSGSVLAGGEVVVLAIDGDTVLVEAVAEEGSLLWLWLTLAGLVVVGAGVTVWLLTRSSRKTTPSTAPVEAAAPAEPEAPGDPEEK
jgi:hypothetical protein